MMEIVIITSKYTANYVIYCRKLNKKLGKKEMIEMII